MDGADPEEDEARLVRVHAVGQVGGPVPLPVVRRRRVEVDRDLLCEGIAQGRRALALVDHELGQPHLGPLAVLEELPELGIS